MANPAKQSKKKSKTQNVSAALETYKDKDFKITLAMVDYKQLLDRTWGYNFLKKAT